MGKEADILNSALIVVDMQNDFLHKDGYFGKAAKNGAPYDMVFFASPATNIKRLAAAFRGAHRPVFFITMVLKPDYSDACFPYWRFPGAIGNKFLVEGTWGAEIIAELTPEEGDHVVVKTGYGGFYNTPLASMLRNLKVGTCVITGVGTPVCVSTTCREGVSRNFLVVVVSDATASTDSKSHEAELLHLAHPFADVMTTNEVIGMLERRHIAL